MSGARERFWERTRSRSSAKAYLQQTAPATDRHSRYEADFQVSEGLHDLIDASVFLVLTGGK